MSKKLISFFTNIIFKFIALLLILFSLPVLIIFGLLINTQFQGPLFYSQERVGKNGKLFTIWKLRTMVRDSDKILEQILISNPKIVKEWEQYGCIKNDPRIAGFWGNIARRYSIDELPQFFNILKGNMCFVGPRPIEFNSTLILSPENKKIRESVKPGITGLWQIGERSNINNIQMMKYDKLYVEKNTLCLDTFIVFNTFKVIFKGTGN